jgi:uncharacterized membrane protein
MKALQTGILTVVFTITSFSILIPVLLSVLIYKEKFDTKKGLALSFAILSLIILK